MKEVTRNFLVGVFVLVSLGALGILMVWFGETPSWLGRGDWELRITGITQLSGVSEGSPVQFNGVEIGRVTALEFADLQRPDRGVDVVTLIGTQYIIPQGAKARVYGALLGVGMGRVDIVVDPNVSSGPLPKKMATIPGEMRSMIGELVTRDMIENFERTIRHIGDLTREWAPVGTNLSSMLEQRTVTDVSVPGAAERGLTPNLSTAVERIDDLMMNLNSVLGDENIQEDAKEVVRDLRDTTTALKRTVELWETESRHISKNVNTGIERIESNLEGSFARLNEVLENLDDSAKSISSVLYHVSKGEGSAGLLVRDERLYEAAVLAVQRLGDAMGTLNRYLRKVEDDGYIVVGQAPTGILRKKFPITRNAEQKTGQANTQ